MRRQAPSGRSIETNATTLRAVGFNPFRQQDKTLTDVALVITFVAVILGVVLWAVFGG